jgi:hypothetical protein
MFQRHVRAILVAAVAFALSASARPLAAQQGTIRGRVTDAASQRPVGDVQVIIVGSSLGALTGPNGEYTIVNAPAGQHTIRARRLGFTLLDKTVTVSAGQGATVDFALAQSATQLEQHVITGTAGAAEKRTLGNSNTQQHVEDIAS